MKAIENEAVLSDNKIIDHTDCEKGENQVDRALENRAGIEEAERVCCENCDERVVFHMKDNEHDFSMGLSTVLKCLEFAIYTGDLPKLPFDWCARVSREYNLGFNYDVMCSD